MKKKKKQTYFPLIKSHHVLVDFMAIFNVEMTESLSLVIESIAKNNKN